MKPVTQLKHEEEFERSWIAPGNTRIELPPVDINLVLARVYRTNEPLRFTRTMLWDMEVKKAFRPDLYIPSVVSAGSSCYWRRPAEPSPSSGARGSASGLSRQSAVWSSNRFTSTLRGRAPLSSGQRNSSTRTGTCFEQEQDSLSFTLSIRSMVVRCDLLTCGASFTSRTNPNRRRSSPQTRGVATSSGNGGSMGNGRAARPRGS